MNFLVDENMPPSLAPRIATLGFTVQDVRDVGLRGAPDTKISEKAIAADSIIITRDRDFANLKHWPLAFTAGVIFVNLPDDTPVKYHQFESDRSFSEAAARIAIGSPYDC